MNHFHAPHFTYVILGTQKIQPGSLSKYETFVRKLNLCSTSINVLYNLISTSFQNTMTENLCSVEDYYIKC